METTIFHKIIYFFSDHFELLVCVNGAILMTLVLVLILLKLRETDFQKLFYAAFKRALYYAVLAGQFLLVILFVYLYWQNYQKPATALDLNSDIFATTGWVKNSTRIYFIDGSKLRSVKANDTGAEDVFQAGDPIREYHFSPDGRYLLILTKSEIFLLDRETDQSRRIDALTSVMARNPEGEKESLSGSISSVQWAPDSRKFVYEVSRWSKFSSQEGAYLYDIAGEEKRAIKSPARRVSSLYWDQQSENLYYFYYEAQGASTGTSAFEARIFRISVSDLSPKLILRIPLEKPAVPIDNLYLRDIHLFLDGSRLSFGLSGKKNDLVSPVGGALGIDEDDFLYFVKKKWFRKRLYRIPREPRVMAMPRHQYKGGDLVIDHIRWIPGGRYAIMEHRYWGVLILEPSTGKVGLLIRANGHTFGWYVPASAKE